MGRVARRRCGVVLPVPQSEIWRRAAAARSPRHTLTLGSFASSGAVKVDAALCSALVWSCCTAQQPDVLLAVDALEFLLSQRRLAASVLLSTEALPLLVSSLSSGCHGVTTRHPDTACRLLAHVQRELRQTTRRGAPFATSSAQPRSGGAADRGVGVPSLPPSSPSYERAVVGALQACFEDLPTHVTLDHVVELLSLGAVTSSTLASLVSWLCSVDRVTAASALLDRVASSNVVLLPPHDAVFQPLINTAGDTGNVELMAKVWQAS